ncbi:MAG TPA: hypothetical protein DF774_14100 [Rheinheimera sp.]|nr:hypothetical protein [Rheinheimera sp.]
MPNVKFRLLKKAPAGAFFMSVIFKSGFVTSLCPFANNVIPSGKLAASGKTRQNPPLHNGLSGVF